VTASDARRRATAPVAAALASAVAALGIPATAAASDPPGVDADAFVLIDRGSGTTIAARDQRERRPIASATKLMTALLTLERTSPDDVLKASGYDADPIESQIGLEEGERMAVRDLMVALLLESANDAAATLAARLDSSTRGFVADMNRRAKELGLDDTSYANPIGFDAPGNYSTASDLAELARLLMRDRLFRGIVDEPRLELRTGDRPRVVFNRNELVGEAPYVDGVKTGHTLGAEHVLVGSATRGDAGVISVVLGAPTEAERDEASVELLSYGLDRFRESHVLRAREPIAEVAAAGRDEQIPVAAGKSVSVTVLKGERVRTLVESPDEVEGPLPAGAAVGSIEVAQGDEVLERVPLVTARAVPEPEDLPTRLASTLREQPILAAAAAGAAILLVAAALLVARRRRRAR
jgi:D-alanyl-D-alanine carboxypeptidase (penicillin-binding protein 5/6)